MKSETPEARIKRMFNKNGALRYIPVMTLNGSVELPTALIGLASCAVGMELLAAYDDPDLVPTCSDEDWIANVRDHAELHYDRLVAEGAWWNFPHTEYASALRKETLTRFEVNLANLPAYFAYLSFARKSEDGCAEHPLPELRVSAMRQLVGWLFGLAYEQAPELFNDKPAKLRPPAWLKLPPDDDPVE